MKIGPKFPLNHQHCYCFSTRFFSLLHCVFVWKILDLHLSVSSACFFLLPCFLCWKILDLSSYFSVLLHCYPVWKILGLIYVFSLFSLQLPVFLVESFQIFLFFLWSLYCFIISQSERIPIGWFQFILIFVDCFTIFHFLQVLVIILKSAWKMAHFYFIPTFLFPWQMDMDVFYNNSAEFHFPFNFFQGCCFVFPFNLYDRFSMLIGDLELSLGSSW